MKRHRRLATIVRGVLVFAAGAPFLPALFQGVPLLDSVGRALDAWFTLQCERDPARGFAGVSVCARCLGIYLGLGCGALFVRPRLRLGWLQLWIATAAVVLLLDTLTEARGLRPASSLLRVVTGLLFAYPIGSVVTRALLPTSVRIEAPPAQPG